VKSHHAGRQDGVAGGGELHVAGVTGRGPSVGQGVGTDLDAHTAGRHYPALLDLEEVGEIGLHGDADQDPGSLVGEVAQDDVLPHTLADIAGAQYQQGAISPASAGQGASHEGRPVPVALKGGQWLHGRAVHLQAPARDHPRVRHEQPLRAVGQDVTAGRAQAERRPFDKSDRCGVTGHDRWCHSRSPRASHRIMIARDGNAGLTVADARRGLDVGQPGSGLVQTRLDDLTYWYAPTAVTESAEYAADAAAARSGGAWLLPNYDEYTVAYRERDLLYDPARRWTFERREDAPFGNVIVVGGRIVGI